MKRRIAGLIITALLFASLGGCALVVHKDKLMLLKRLGENQQEIQEYGDAQEEMFYRLKDDIQNNRVREGLLKEEVSTLYGEPIFCRSLERPDRFQERCLYRHPTRYSSTDKIYLTFDSARKLESWELIEAGN